LTTWLIEDVEFLYAIVLLLQFVNLQAEEAHFSCTISAL